ncbi:MAG: CPBP family intramembrane metalloprotease [Nitrospirae bacterium]|nr:CPBP family intramembrane metalloprotease [Nitrospirota bacterium]MBI3391916.1 CPBP family intramembrane metalloprotease [Nitrospirota bacterium]
MSATSNVTDDQAAQGRSADSDGVVPTPWGIWPTLGFSAVVVAAFLIVQVFVGGVFAAIMMAQNPGLDVGDLSRDLEFNPLVLSASTLATAAVCTGLVLLFAGLRKGISLKRYLGINGVEGRVLLRWLVLVGVLAAGSDGLSWFLGRPLVPDFMVRVYRSALGFPLAWWLLVTAVIVAGPIFEEIFFRGFLLQGLRYSRLTSVGAVLLTSLAWAEIHAQYDLFDQVSIFIFGLFLGYARLKTGSVFTTLAMHAVMNLVAIVETGVFLGRSQA